MTASGETTGVSDKRRADRRGPTLVPDNPDKRLFQLFRAAQLELMSIMADIDESQPEALCDSERFFRISDEILDTPAQTFAGVAIKIRAALVSFMAACKFGGIELADDALPIKTLSAAAEDAERLSGVKLTLLAAVRAGRLPSEPPL